jgi:type III secretory pathway component EscS
MIILLVLTPFLFAASIFGLIIAILNEGSKEAQEHMDQIWEEYLNETKQ